MTTLGNAQYMNQFAQTTVRGALDLLLNHNIITAKLENEDVPDLVSSAGDLVKFTPGANGIPVVAEFIYDDMADSFGTLYGFVVKDVKTSEYTTGMTLGVALDGCVMQMIAEEVINSGDRVAYNATNDTPTNTGKIIKVPAAATTGKIDCGFALDSATAAGQLIRVLIKF